jgi:hypothetical protein
LEETQKQETVGMVNTIGDYKQIDLYLQFGYETNFLISTIHKMRRNTKVKDALNSTKRW